MSELSEIWVYLAREPLAALTATLLAWLGALRLQQFMGRHPLANPVLFAVALLAAGLLLTGIDYRSYFEGAQFVHFLLGPATVALAVVVGTLSAIAFTGRLAQWLLRRLG